MEDLFLGILSLVMAVLIFIAGWLVREKRVTWLISGYNTAPKEEKETYDIEKMCLYVGNMVYLIGGIYLVIGVFSLIFSPYSFAIFMVGNGIGLIVMIAGLVYLNTGNRLKKGSGG